MQSSMMTHRLLSFSQVQLAAATKLKEKPAATSTTTTTTTPAEKASKPIENQTPIPPPSSGLHDPNKTYSDKIRRLVDEISKLSLVDVMDLNELLKVDYLLTPSSNLVVF